MSEKPAKTGSLDFTSLSIEGAFVFSTRQREDNRGWFARFFCAGEFAEATGRIFNPVQCNMSLTKKKGSVRGMHYQLPPVAESKIVRCVQGAVFDVILDLRKGSPTFLQWQGVELTPEKMNAIVVPKGCAHGFQTLEEETRLIYLHDAVYSASLERGVNLCDRKAAIEWPLSVSDISERDAALPIIKEDFGGIEL